MSGEMPESKVSLSLLKDELVGSCSFCHVVFNVRYRDRDGAIHDPATGDLVCRKCARKSGNDSTYDDLFSLAIRDIFASPFFIKREARLSSSGPCRFENSPCSAIPSAWNFFFKGDMANLGKCPKHPDKDCATMDTFSLSVVCMDCIDPSKWSYVSLTESYPVLNKSIVETLTTSFYLRKPDDANISNLSKNVDKGNVMLAMLREMNPVVNHLYSFTNELRSVMALVYDQLSQLAQSEHPIASMGIDWKGLAGDVGGFMGSIAYVFHEGVQSVERSLHRINGTVLEALEIVGLEDVHVEEMGKTVLSSRPVTPATVAGVALVAGTLESLRATLQKGDIGGLSKFNVSNLDTFLSLAEVLNRNSLDPIRSACASLGEIMLVNDLNGVVLLGHLNRLFETIRALDSKYFELFTYPRPRYGLKKLILWKIDLTYKLNREALFQETLNALMYDAKTLDRSLTHHTLNIIQQFEAVGDPDAPLLRALLKYNRKVGSNYWHFKDALDKGCTHPLLYYFLGNCYLGSQDPSIRDIGKALECYQTTIIGTYSFTHSCQPYLAYPVN